MVINRSHVEQAFEIIRANGIAPNKPSTKWDVIDPRTAERFPPKAVLRIAKEIAGDNSRLQGGGWPTNDPLENLGFEIVLKTHLEESDELTDIKSIFESDVEETTKQRLINARLGQGGFREALLELWEGRCPLTECDISAVLRASHIKAWKDSNNSERLNPYNGILLAASVDALFDKNLITFSPSGDLLVLSSLEKETLERLGLRNGQRIVINEKSQPFMQGHRRKSEEKIGTFTVF